MNSALLDGRCAYALDLPSIEAVQTLSRILQHVSKSLFEVVHVLGCHQLNEYSRWHLAFMVTRQTPCVRICASLSSSEVEALRI